MQPQSYPPVSPQPSVQQTPKKRFSKILFVLMIITGVVALGCGIAWAVLGSKLSSDNGKTPMGAVALIEPKEAAPAEVTIESKLGVRATFNARELAGFGFADNVTYSADEVKQVRAYTVVRVKPVETSEATRNDTATESPELRITTSADKKYWPTLQAQPAYKDASKADILVRETIKQRMTDKNITASDVETKNINSVDYRKVIFTYKSEQYGIPTERREDCYVSVQHDRPYVACIRNIRAANFSVVPQLETVLASLSYSEPDKALLTESVDDQQKASMLDSKADEKVNAKAEAAPKTTEKKDEKVPAYLAKTADFERYANAIPAVVRVGTLYCADIKLSLPDGGAGPQLSSACIDKSGTGFFVSRDGVIATSGSNVQVSPQEAVRSYITNAPDSARMYDRLNRVLSYLVQSRAIMQTDADAITAGVQQRDQDIIDKVTNIASKIPAENISIVKESYKYAIQTSNKPIVVKTNSDDSLDFTYSDTVFDASVAGVNYSTDKTRQQIYNGETLENDAALLKIKKDQTYPTITLSPSSNITKGGMVGVVGMPMYAFGSIDSSQLRSTPLYRQGKVDQILSGPNSQRLFALTTPSHAGLSGAPVFNEEGRAVALGSYGNINCPDKKCFANAVVRDISGINAVAKARNITLEPSSIVSETWQTAMNEYRKGNYKVAHNLFNKSAELYPANYLAPQFAAYSKAQFNSSSDTSLYNQITEILQLVLLICGIAFVLLLIAKLASKIFIKPHVETQYGQMNTGQYIDPNQWQKQGNYQQPTAYQQGAPQAPSYPQQSEATPPVYQQPSQSPQQYPPEQPYQNQPYQPPSREQDTPQNTNWSR